MNLAWRLLWAHGLEQRMRVVAGLGLLIAGAGVMLLQPWPLKLVVDSVIGRRPLPSGWVLAGGPTEPLSILAILCVLTVIIQLALSALHIASTQILVSVGLRMVLRLRSAVFDHLQRLSLAFHDATTVGDSLYRVSWDTYSVQTLFNQGLIPTVESVLKICGIALILFSSDPLLAVIATATGIPLIVLVRWLDRPMSERSLRLHERESDVTSRVQEMLSGIRAVQAFGREEHESERFRTRAEASLKANLKLTLAQTGSQAAVALLLAAGTSLVIWVAAGRGLEGRLSAGDVVLTVSYLAMLYKPIEALAYTATSVQQASAGIRRVLELLRTQPDVADRDNARPLPTPVAGCLRVEGLSFEYRDGQPVLNDISLDIQPGTRVALVGASGAGKSTLASLLLRFYEPTSGRILLDGHDLRDLTLKSVRQNIALVLQEPLLFGTSIRENIGYGKPDATFEEIRQAAVIAGVDDFVKLLPDGYETHIGERGVLLSGGQRQRISLARAFLKDAPILIMDEPTGALDAGTEHALMLAAEKLMQGRTTIIIAHRLSTIRNADQIVVLQNGRIVEAGSHDQLMRSGCTYSELYRLQFNEPPVASRLEKS
jgi:ATP-binding cassette subfamily B protein/subfamily B ATP-binding cassette protein MsbA